MEALIIFLVVLVFIVCILLIASVLLQEDKSGGGIGMIGGSSQSFFGSSSGTMLSRITAILFSVFVVLIVLIGLIASRYSNDNLFTESDIENLSTNNSDVSKKLLATAPEKINIDDFENQIVAKITDEKNKAFIVSLYKKESNHYALKQKLKSDESKKAAGILNFIGFTMEASTTVIKTNDVSTDVVNMNADTTQD